MKKSKFASSLTYNSAAPTCFEPIRGEKKTVQGESYTVKELFERHMRGQMPNLRDESYWEDTNDFDSIDFQALRYADPHEKAELLLEVSRKAMKAKQAIEEWKANQEKDSDYDSSDSAPRQADSKKPKADGKRADSEAKSEAKRSAEPNDSASEDDG